jgi:oxygen-independent coproporphyrinogen-3 oxidase
VNHTPAPGGADPGADLGSGDAELGLYIHIPFCERKCPYCDFNTYAGLQSRFQATVNALCTEMERWAAVLRDRTVGSVFLGGGTPTVLDAAQLGQLFDALRRCFVLAERCEITSEANPGTVDQAKFAALRSLGVNRLSLGVQSFQPDELRFLGRIHGVEDVYAAVAAARSAGFDNVNLDFIFGLPHQPLAAWRDTLEQALALQPEHLSLYSLIVEPQTPLYHWVESGRVDAPDDDAAAELYEYAIDRLGRAGYLHYEVSNWAQRQPAEMDAAPDTVTPARAGRHNLLYWRNGEYLGVGPGAHSHLRATDEHSGASVSRRWGNCKPVAGYVKRVQAGASVVESSEEVTGLASMGETMMLGLRLVREGVAFERFRRLHGESLPDVFAQELAGLAVQGLLRSDGERVTLTARGLMVGNQVFARFLPDLGSEA